MKPTLYIHIGRPKVGSTAIQAFLLRNRSALLRQGFCYPKTGLFHGASHQLSLVFLPELSDFKFARKLDANVLYQELVTEVASSGAEKAIISSENFWMLKPKVLPALLRKAFEVRIVAYLRRQDEVLISSFIQEVRGGKHALDHSMEDYLEDPVRLRLLDYDQMLQPWEQLFGIGNVLVRVLGDDKTQPSVERDFLKVLGISELEDFEFGNKRRNASPAVDILRILEDSRRFQVGEMAQRQLAATLSEVSLHMDTDPRYDPKQLISMDQRRQLLDQFADSNRRLFLRHDCNGVRFRELEANAKDTPPTRELDTDRYLQAILGMLAYQQRQIQVLTSRLNRATGHDQHELRAHGEMQNPARESSGGSRWRQLLRRIGSRLVSR